MKKELKAVRIMRRESELPSNVANEIELLWKTMLPGLPREPENQSTHHVIYVHPPAFIALLRNNNTVQTGRIAMAEDRYASVSAFRGNRRRLD